MDYNTYDDYRNERKVKEKCLLYRKLPIYSPRNNMGISYVPYNNTLP